MQHALSHNGNDCRLVTNDTGSQASSPRVAVAVLAAGHGKRMCSRSPKHLHPVGGIPIVERILRAGMAIAPDRLLAIVSPTLADLPRTLEMAGQFETIVQDPPRGTADAVRHALEAVPDADLLVSLLGDSPLLTGDMVRQLTAGASANAARLTILTCWLPDAASYGRIHRDEQGRVTSIIEAKNDDPAYRTGPTEINSGIMVLDAAWARAALDRLRLDPVTQEYLLTDLVAMAAAEHRAGEPWPVDTVDAPASVALGVNDRLQQAEADAILRDETRRRLMRSGVTIIGPETVFVDDTVEIGPDTVILPHSMITGRTTIGSGCRIGPHAVLHNATLGNDVHVQSSTIEDSTMQDGADAGPYAHLRSGTVVGPGAHVGNFAEIKNSTLGAGAKSGHFSYLGDATIGEDVNIGAGTITANFDGSRKHRTVIGAGAFVGSDSVLVAPVTIGQGGRTGAGAVVTRDVAPHSTVVGVPARPVATRSDGTGDRHTPDAGKE